MKKFEIGVHWPPPAEFINEEQYDALMHANITYIDHALEKAEDNFRSLELLERRGMRATCNDADYEKIYHASDEEIDALVDRYSGHPAVYGVYVKDEPQFPTLERYAEIYKRICARNPQLVPYVNLYPMYADVEHQLAVAEPLTHIQETRGSQPPVVVELAGVSTLGLSFRTPSEIRRRLAWFEPGIRVSSGSDRPIALAIYEDASKRRKLAASVCHPAKLADDRVRFEVHADLQPGREYFFELHFPGGEEGVVCETGVVRVDSRLTQSSLNEAAASADSSARCLANGIAADWGLHFTACYQNAYSDYLLKWVVEAKPVCLMFDFYPFKTDGDHGDYFLNLELVKDAGKQGNVPIAGYLQSVGIAGMLRRPNENELRYNVYTMLAYGMKKLNWFTWWTPQPNEGGEVFTDAIITADGRMTDLYVPVAKLSGEIAKLGPHLIELELEAVYHQGELPAGTKELPRELGWSTETRSEPLLISFFRDGDGAKYVMVVNRDYEASRDVTLNLLAGPDSIYEISKHTGVLEKAAYDQVTEKLFLSFQPGEGRLFRVEVAVLS